MELYIQDKKILNVWPKIIYECSN